MTASLRFALPLVLLTGCVDGYLPAEEPLCEERLLPGPEAQDYLVVRSIWIGFAGDYEPPLTIHRDGRLTRVYAGGEVRELPSLGAERVAQLEADLTATGVYDEASGCYPAGGASLSPDSGCDFRLTFAAPGGDLRVAGCQIPAAVREADGLVLAYEREARAAAEE
ncbi:MAG: hypothetical protein VYE22_00515 [Myxococcota bacterium]|nr:hypothetical protein [Myxococcota bacterium]